MQKSNKWELIGEKRENKQIFQTLVTLFNIDAEISLFKMKVTGYWLQLSVIS